MELRAVFEALRSIPARIPIIVEADSKYAIKALTEWLPTWKTRGWMTASKQPVANRAAILGVDRLLEGRAVEWRHVRGHSGHALNEQADAHARGAALAMQRGRRPPAGPLDCLDRILSAFRE
jgi:ribonuclease HI